MMGEWQWWIMVVDGYYWFKLIIMGDQWLLMAIPSHTQKKSLGNCQFLDDFLAMVKLQEGIAVVIMILLVMMLLIITIADNGW